jgi:hypothetical protein
LFERIQPFAATFTTTMSREAILDAWRSHGTVARQAGSRFHAIIDAIEHELAGADQFEVPYTTRGWYARFRA